MAGIEPASERIERRTSTSVSDYYSRRWGGNLQPKPNNQPFGPESPLSCKSRQFTRHFSIVSPVLLPAEERNRQTWPAIDH